MSATGRIAWIDSAKGWVTLLALISSVPHVPDPLLRWLYAFLVPLAVFLSGFVWKNTTSESGIVVIRQLAHRWLWPYFILMLLSWVWGFMQGHQNGWRPMIGLVLGLDGFGHWMETNPALWFFPFLFSVHLLAHQLFKIHELWVLGFSFLGLLWLRFSPIPLPWGLDMAMAALPFFLLGVKLRVWNIWMEPRRWSPWVAFVFLIVLTIAASKNGIPLADWSAGKLRPEWAVIPIALFGVVAWLPMARLMDLSWIGRHSLWIYGLHYPLYQLFSDMFGWLIGRAPHSPDFLYLVVFYPVVATLLVVRIRKWLLRRDQLST